MKRKNSYERVRMQTTAYVLRPIFTGWSETEPHSLACFSSEGLSVHEATTIRRILVVFRLLPFILVELGNLEERRVDPCTYSTHELRHIWHLHGSYQCRSIRETLHISSSSVTAIPKRGLVTPGRGSDTQD
eukprot:scaffold384_cov238-Pinguiococcus_pyrenoidosus.AAC.12